jgi:hypothetical protein
MTSTRPPGGHDGRSALPAAVRASGVRQPGDPVAHRGSGRRRPVTSRTDRPRNPGRLRIGRHRPPNTSLVGPFGCGPVPARHVPRRGRGCASVPDRAPRRRPHRHRPAGGLQRPGHPPPAVAGRGPQAASRAVHDGHGSRSAGPVPGRPTPSASRPRASRPRSLVVLEAPTLGCCLPVLGRGQAERQLTSQLVTRQPRIVPRVLVGAVLAAKVGRVVQPVRSCGAE